VNVLYGDVRVRDRVRDRDLLLTYMYTLNFLNNYFAAILETAAVSFTLGTIPLPGSSTVWRFSSSGFTDSDYISLFMYFL
jgi:hypothetical protein